VKSKIKITGYRLIAVLATSAAISLGGIGLSGSQVNGQVYYCETVEVEYNGKVREFEECGLDFSIEPEKEEDCGGSTVCLNTLKNAHCSRVLTARDGWMDKECDADCPRGYKLVYRNDRIQCAKN